ncbi:MAG: hypothetical protein IPK79_11290 [Vampirovibrionales bacterium]|nr:hypothetical protein [Vampirovibrionales bacterium]
MSFQLPPSVTGPRFGRAAMPGSKKNDPKNPAEPPLKIDAPPTLTLRDYGKQTRALSDERHNIPRPFGYALNNPLGWAEYNRTMAQIADKQTTLRAQLTPEFMRGAMTYLPAVSRERLAKYLISPQFTADLLSSSQGPDAVMRNFITLLGPPVVKYCQTQAQEAANLSDTRAHRHMRTLERELKDLNAELKWLPVNAQDAPRGTTRQELEDNQKRAQELKEDIEARDTQLMALQRFVPLKTALMPLLDAVPPADYDDIKPALDETVADFNRAHGADPIVHVDRQTLGAGSMAQVHGARTQSGKRLIVKVFRPEASKTHFDEYHRFTQFALLFLMGGDKRAWAAKQAQLLMDVFKEEVSPEREQLHARRLKARIQREKLPIKIPQVLSVSPSGFVEEFAEGENLSRLAQSDRAKAAEVMQTLGPALVKSFFLWPERFLDPQGGNLKAPGAIFDYGRMALLAPRVNQALHGIVRDFLLVMAKESQLRREAAGKGDSGNQKEKLNKKINELVPELFKKVDRHIQPLLKPNLKLKPEEIAHIRYRFISDQYYINPQDIDQQSRKLLHSEERHLSKQGIFFGLLQNLAELSDRGKTVKLTEFGSPLTRQDVAHGREKLRAVMAPYFEYNQKNVSDATIEAWLKKEGQAKFDEFAPYLGPPNGNGLINRLIGSRRNMTELQKDAPSVKNKPKSPKSKDDNTDLGNAKQWLAYFQSNLAQAQAALAQAENAPNAGSDAGRTRVEELKKQRTQLQKQIKEKEKYVKDLQKTGKQAEEGLKRETARFEDFYQKAMRDDDVRQALVKAVRWNRQLETLAESLYTDILKGHSLAKEERAYLIGFLKADLYREYQPTVRDDADFDD